MSERRWEPVFWCDEDQEWEPRYDRPPMTDAEVLAEMGTEALLRWLRQQALKEGWTFDARAMYEIMEADDG